MYPNVKVEELPTPRTFQSHFRYDNMPCGLPSTTPCKYIYVTRNPKDLAVSYYHHHRGFKSTYRVELTWESFFNKFASGWVDFGSYFEFSKPLGAISNSYNLFEYRMHVNLKKLKIEPTISYNNGVLQAPVQCYWLIWLVRVVWLHECLCMQHI